MSQQYFIVLISCMIQPVSRRRGGTVAFELPAVGTYFIALHREASKVRRGAVIIMLDDSLSHSEDESAQDAGLIHAFNAVF